VGVEPKWWPKTPEEAFRHISKVTRIPYILSAYGVALIFALMMVAIPAIAIRQILPRVPQIHHTGMAILTLVYLVVVIAFAAYAYHVGMAWFGKLGEEPKREDLATRVAEDLFHIPISEEATAHFKRLLYMYEDTDDDDE
jgi:ABC-type multidrug transport system fused ATPase/permease subunit